MKMCLPRFALKKFLFKYPLDLGAKIFAIIMICVNIICITVLSIDMIGLKSCDTCTSSILRNSYAFSGTAIIYCTILVLINAWFLWAINKRKTSVILSWVVVTSMWLTQASCLMLVLLCMYMEEAVLSIWIISAIFGGIAFCIAAYGICIGYGLWFEIKSLSQTSTANELLK